MDGFARTKTFWIIWRCVAFLFHFTLTIVYASALVWSEFRFREKSQLAEERNQTLDSDVELSFPGQWKFLTRWNHTIQLTVFCLAVLEDIIWFTNRVVYNKRETTALSAHHSNIRDLNPSTVNCSDWIIYSCAFPLGVLVTLLFWGLYLIHPEMVVSKNADSPPLLNHIVHTLVGPLIVLEVALVHHQKPKDTACLTTLVIVITAYLTLVFGLGLLKNIWIYGILARLGWLSRISFVCACVIVSIVLYFLGWILYTLLWSEDRKTFFVNGPEKGVNNNDAEVSLISIQDSNSCF